MVTDQIYVGLSSPYFEKGSDQLRKEDLELNQVFSFMMPFTNVMWSTLSAMTVFNVFVIWLVESTTSHESGSLPFGQVGAILWFPIATLFYGGHRESPRNNLTYFVLAPWFILILVVSSTYTQSFTSMITSSDTEASPCWLDIKNLKKTNAIVGSDKKHSIMFQYLVKVIGFQKKNIKHIAQSSFDDYAKALSTGNIKAAFFWTPGDRFFLAKYCKSFGNPNCNRHGSSIVIKSFSFSSGYVNLLLKVFQRSSSFVNEMLEAVLGFKQMKEEDLDMLSLSDCSSSTSDGTMKRGIGPGPFSDYEAFKNLNSRRLPILCTVTSYEIVEINVFTRRAKVTVICALSARAEATAVNESSTSCMSRRMHEIVYQMITVIGYYWELEPGMLIYEKSDSV
ncbi:hypothetical protein Gohar_021557 [Gossypium harknessii]|uniref:Ionotropic glutamate receptor C-terminal domain-containing protein n=1 Tax=Gossypium harknessii TaxID=34285 RepID=A0A7J9ICJ4_9ROSI|nr:hypothetical protein [Gossypium harknessii]